MSTKGRMDKQIVVYSHYEILCNKENEQTKLHVTRSMNYPNVTLKDGEGDGTPLQYSCLENPMGGGAWWAAIHGVAKSQTRPSDFTVTFHFHALEKEMAAHSSALAWRIPGTGEPGGLPSMGSHRVGHDWSDLAAAAAMLKERSRTWKSIYAMIWSVRVKTNVN